MYIIYINEYIHDYNGECFKLTHEYLIFCVFSVISDSCPKNILIIQHLTDLTLTCLSLQDLVEDL